MTVLATIAIDADVFALGEVLSDGDTGTRVELTQFVPTADSLVPYFWVTHSADHDAFEPIVTFSWVASVPVVASLSVSSPVPPPERSVRSIRQPCSRAIPVSRALRSVLSVATTARKASSRRLRLRSGSTCSWTSSHGRLSKPVANSGAVNRDVGLGDEAAGLPQCDPSAAEYHDSLASERTEQRNHDPEQFPSILNGCGADGRAVARLDSSVASMERRSCRSTCSNRPDHRRERSGSGHRATLSAFVSGSMYCFHSWRRGSA